MVATAAVLSSMPPEQEQRFPCCFPFPAMALKGIPVLKAAAKETKPAGKPSGEAAGKPAGEAAGKPSAKSLDKPSAKPSAKSASKLLAKPGDKPPPEPAAPGTLSKKLTMFYQGCAVVAVLSIITIIVMTIMLLKVYRMKNPYESPLKRLRSVFTSVVDKPNLHSDDDMMLAGAVENLPQKLQDADEEFELQKKRYQALFQKAMRSSSGPWKLHRKSLYYFATGEKTWYDAENFCTSRDAHLASVLDDEEQDFITSQIKEASWIGLTDENKKGRWAWTDGSGLQKQYWSYRDPSHVQRAGESNRDCILMVPSSTNHNWKDHDCHKLYGWVCKEKLDSE